MPEFGWGSKSSVRDWLWAEGYKFDFYQAVRLLEMMYPDSVPIGQGPDADQEAARFRSNVTLDFPASDLQEIEPPRGPNSRPTVIVNFLSLAGAEGPLPLPFTEFLLERIQRHDTGLRDFLDIFHHRLIALMYRANKMHRVALTLRSPEQSPITEYLYSLSGLGVPSLRRRMGIPDRALLFYSGLIWQQPRSAAGLERILSDYFQVPAAVKPFLGKWRALEPEDWTRLGRAALGQGAALGTRAWDQAAGFEVELGPLTYLQLLDLLPNGSAFGPLCQWSRFYAGTELDFQFKLKLLASEVPESRLGRTHLGWTSWLKSQPSGPENAQVTLRPAPDYEGPVA